MWNLKRNYINELFQNRNRFTGFKKELMVARAGRGDGEG